MDHNGSETSPPPPPTDEVQTAESAVTVAGNIDLLTLILTRLDAKPLMRFKSVSKQWLSLISSPNFSRLHILRNPNPKPSALFFGRTGHEFISLDDQSPPLRPRPFGSPPFCPGRSSFEVLSSCNGLLLCSPVCKSMTQIFEDKNYIFNPTTKQFSPLTLPAGYNDWWHSKRYILAFDPLRSPHYKVLMVSCEDWSVDIFRKDVSKRFELHIYSSETSSWKKHGTKFEWPLFDAFKDGVYLNGVMHWPSQNQGFMCFDIDLECTRAMPEPPGFRRQIIRCFGKSGGDLHVVYVLGYRMFVLVAERDYSKWSLKYIVDIKLLMASYPRMIGSVRGRIRIQDYNFSFLSILKLGDDQDEQLLLHVPGKVISYSFKTKGIKVLRDSLPGKVYKRQDCLRSFDGHLYFETLACA